MGLTWDTTKCNPDLPIDDADTVLRDVLIWGMMPAAIGWEITKDNAEELFFRLHLIELVDGAYRIENGNPKFFQPNEIRRWIGLKVNVSPESNSKWSAKVMRNYRRDAHRLWNKEK